MVWPDHSGTPQILPQLGQDAKRTHERPATRNPFNKAKTLDHLVESEKLVKIKMEPGTEEILPAKHHNDIFVRVKDLAKSIHSNQTGPFLYTSQQGNRYIMIAIHLDANYIFCKPMKNRSEDEMIEACQKIINKIKAAGLGLKSHRLDNKASKA
jgi:hypothetical protein